MAATMATMAILNAKCLNTTAKPFTTTPSKSPTSKPNSLLSLSNLPKGLLTSTPSSSPIPLLSSTALAGAVFSTLSSCDPAFAVQQIADLAAEAGSSDNRGLALLLPIIPAIGWVLFNILQPALNQLNRMRSERGVIVGLGIGGGLAASGFFGDEAAMAGEIAGVAEAAGTGSDNRGTLLLLVVLPAIGWVLFNILQPALNQLNRMRSQ